MLLKLFRENVRFINDDVLCFGLYKLAEPRCNCYAINYKPFSMVFMFVFAQCLLHGFNGHLVLALFHFYTKICGAPAHGAIFLFALSPYSGVGGLLCEFFVVVVVVVKFSIGSCPCQFSIMFKLKALIIVSSISQANLMKYKY